MAKPIYNKPALTIQAQAKLLYSRNLTGINNAELLKELERTSYYRISGYAFPYQDKKNNDRFTINNAWKVIKSDYDFDSSLRHLLFKAIGLIEITLRTQLIYQMSITHGANWYSDTTLFRDATKLAKDHADLLKNWNRSSDLFVNHYNATYDTSKEPPAWMIFETTTFGSLSRYFENIKMKDPAKNAICNYWHITDRKDYATFSNWLKNINTVRNICAHHSRLFSRVFPYKAIPLQKCLDKNFIMNWQNNTKVYASVCIIRNLLSICAPEFRFDKKLKKTLKHVTKNQLSFMGFPADWKKWF
ncbi:MAG: Abi family protein [Treponema sp.]|nr:Abi family protein [Treponema sp.]